jgi:hypothetical protein
LRMREGQKIENITAVKSDWNFDIPYNNKSNISINARQSMCRRRAQVATVALLHILHDRLKITFSAIISP